MTSESDVNRRQKVDPRTESIYLFLYRLPHDKTAPQKRLFKRRTPKTAPGQNTGHSYAHAHILQTKNAREHCVHVTERME